MRGLAQLTGIHLDLDWRTSIVSVLLLPILISLGLWQLQRADEKAGINTQWELRRSQSPVPLQSLDSTNTESLQYRPVQLSGQFVSAKYFLLDNRIHRGQFGNEVLAVFKLKDSGKAVLVNRGWIAADSSRRQEPAISEANGPATITGYVYVSPGDPYLLADTALESGWPKRIQAIEMDKLGAAVEQDMGVELFPHPVRIDSDSAAALTVDWQVVNVSPEKHTGYAVQWFTMAAALFILFILRSSNLWQVLTGGSRTQ
ncbi:MAG: surfeit locus 1 family protein [Halioglobus sp.]